MLSYRNAIEEKTFEFTEKNLQNLNDLKMKHEEEVEEIKKSFEEKLEALTQKVCFRCLYDEVGSHCFDFSKILKKI